jgi:hypothetical protein
MAFLDGKVDYGDEIPIGIGDLVLKVTCLSCPLQLQRVLRVNGEPALVYFRSRSGLTNLYVVKGHDSFDDLDWYDLESGEVKEWPVSEEHWVSRRRIKDVVLRALATTLLSAELRGSR